MSQREIKFRGKRKCGSQWIVGDLNHINGIVYIFDRSDDAPLNSPDWFEVDPKTVGEFIGIETNKGVKIYEDDIIQSFDSEGNPILHFVKYSRNKACFTAVYLTKNGHGFSGGLSENWISEFDKEVIGNIYDNPELIPTKE